MQHPAFNAQHAQMLLARGMMGPMAQRPPGGMYRPPSNGLFQGPDQGPLPPGPAPRMRVPHQGQGSVIRHMSQHGAHHSQQQQSQQHVHQHASQQLPHVSAAYHAQAQVNGVSGSASQVRPASQGRSQDTLHQIHHIAAQATNLPESMQNRVDSASVKGVFGWTQIDGVEIPFLLRDEKKYLAVRMVEMKLLSKYPSTYPDELKSRPPLMSHYITESEAKILNEINKHHCQGEYGQQQFVTQDLIVKMTDFEEFYNIVKKHFPPSVLAQLPHTQSSASSHEKKVDGGWIQMNNTVVPYVIRGKARYVPLSVIRYAAGLLTDVRVDGENPKEEECNFLNEACRTAGVEFNFVRTTKLVMLDLVQRLCTFKISISELPKDDPFSQAEYQGSLEDEKNDESVPSSGGTMSLSTNQMPYPGLPSGASSRAASSGPSPPSAASGTPTSQTASQAASVPYWMNQHLGIYPGAQGGFPPPGTGPHGMRGPARPTSASAVPHQHPTSQANLANHGPSANRSSSQGTHVSPTASQYQPKSNEVNNNSFGGAQRRHSHEAVDMSRELASPREKKDNSNPSTPSGTPLGRSLSSSSLPQATTPVPRTSSAGSGGGGGGMNRSTPEGSPQTVIQPGPLGMMSGMPSLHPSLQVGHDGHPVLGSLVPPGHPGWHPMMNNPAEYHKMVQIMQLQAMAQQQQQQQHQLQQQLQILEQHHLQQQRIKQNEAMTKVPKPGPPRHEVPRSTASGLQQARGRSSTPSSSQSQPPPSGQQNNGSKPLPGSTPQGTVNKSSLTQAVIQRVEFQGKTLSCIVKGERKEYYALVEALSRVYFPNCTLEDFQFALEKSLQIPLVKLTEEEERSFISFYNIPTKTLMCNKVIRLAEFQELIPKLKALFNRPGSTPPRGTVLVTAQSSKDTNQEENKESSSAPDTPSVNSEAVGKISAALKAYIGKRPALSDNESTDGLDSPGPSKQAKVSLEDAVNRLKQFQAEQKSKRKSSRPERRTGSQSPTSDTPTEYQARSPEPEMQEAVSDNDASKTTAENEQANDSAPMEVDGGDGVPVESHPNPLVLLPSQSDILDTNLKASSKDVQNTLMAVESGETSSSNINVQGAGSDREAMVTDSSSESCNGQVSQEKPTEQSADPAQASARSLCPEKEKNVETSTGEWANTQPETAPDDFQLDQASQRSQNQTEVPATRSTPMGITYTAVELSMSDSDSESDNDQADRPLNLASIAATDEKVSEAEQALASEQKDTDYADLFNIENIAQGNNDGILHKEKEDSIAGLSPASKEADTAGSLNKSSDDHSTRETGKEGENVFSNQPVNLHSTPTAHNNITQGQLSLDLNTSSNISNSNQPINLISDEKSAISEHSKGENIEIKDVNNESGTGSVSAESRLEVAEAQSASAIVDNEYDTQTADQGIGINASLSLNKFCDTQLPGEADTQGSDMGNASGHSKEYIQYSSVYDKPNDKQMGNDRCNEPDAESTSQVSVILSQPLSHDMSMEASSNNPSSMVSSEDSGSNLVPIGIEKSSAFAHMETVKAKETEHPVDSVISDQSEESKSLWTNSIYDTQYNNTDTAIQEAPSSKYAEQQTLAQAESENADQINVSDQHSVIDHSGNTPSTCIAQWLVNPEVENLTKESNVTDDTNNDQLKKKDDLTEDGHIQSDGKKLISNDHCLLDNVECNSESITKDPNEVSTDYAMSSSEVNAGSLQTKPQQAQGTSPSMPVMDLFPGLNDEEEEEEGDVESSKEQDHIPLENSSDNLKPDSVSDNSKTISHSLTSDQIKNDSEANLKANVEPATSGENHDVAEDLHTKAIDESNEGVKQATTMEETELPDTNIIITNQESNETFTIRLEEPMDVSMVGDSVEDNIAVTKSTREEAVTDNTNTSDTTVEGVMDTGVIEVNSLNMEESSEISIFVNDNNQATSESGIDNLQIVHTLLSDSIDSSHVDHQDKGGTIQSVGESVENKGADEGIVNMDVGGEGVTANQNYDNVTGSVCYTNVNEADPKESIDVNAAINTKNIKIGNMNIEVGDTMNVSAADNEIQDTGNMDATDKVPVDDLAMGNTTNINIIDSSASAHQEDSAKEISTAINAILGIDSEGTLAVDSDKLLTDVSNATENPAESVHLGDKIQESAINGNVTDREQHQPSPEEAPSLETTNENNSQKDSGPSTDSEQLDNSILSAGEDIEAPDSDLEAKLLASPPFSRAETPAMQGQNEASPSKISIIPQNTSDSLVEKLTTEDANDPLSTCMKINEGQRESEDSAHTDLQKDENTEPTLTASSLEATTDNNSFYKQEQPLAKPSTEESSVILTVTTSKEATNEDSEKNIEKKEESLNVNTSSDKESNSCL